MAMRGKSVKSYVMRLGREERDRLEGLIRKGKSPTQWPVEGADFIEGGCFASWRWAATQDHGDP
jgi:hypothetical protein